MVIKIPSKTLTVRITDEQHNNLNRIVENLGFKSKNSVFCTLINEYSEYKVCGKCAAINPRDSVYCNKCGGILLQDHANTNTNTTGSSTSGIPYTYLDFLSDASDIKTRLETLLADVMKLELMSNYVSTVDTLNSGSDSDLQINMDSLKRNFDNVMTAIKGYAAEIYLHSERVKVQK